MSKVRESVSQALADIPYTIARAEVYIEIYKAHPARKLKQATAALFKAVLISLRLILEYFARNSLGKHSKMLLQYTRQHLFPSQDYENTRAGKCL